MLLLVLIFVLVAFALLLVALASSTAAWAWVSVVVSVAAAGILIADWAKRRAAVRTNGPVDRPLGGPQRGGPVHIEESPTTAIPVSKPVVEPATEVFPALRQGYPSAQTSSGKDHASAYAVPPGSDDRPFGAEPKADDSTRVDNSGERQSPNVTPEVESSPKEATTASTGQSTAPSGGHPEGEFGKAAAGAAAAAAVPLATGIAKGKQADPARPKDQPSAKDKDKDGRPAGSGSQREDDYSQWQPKATDPAAQRDADKRESDKRDSDKRDSDQWSGGKRDSVEPDAKSDAGRPDAKQGPAEGADRKFAPTQQVPSQQDGQRQSSRTPRQAPPPGQVPPPGQAPSGAGATTSGPQEGVPAGQGRGPGGNADRTSADRTTAISTAAVAGAGAAGLAAASAGKQGQSGKQGSDAAPPHIEADPTTAIPVMGGAGRPGQSDTKGNPLARAEATQAITPVKGGPPAEPGEEQPEAAALATASKLNDQVLVIDEHPRFHLAGCRVLAGTETIPLPAKEAIEYGFSPCSVCSPVRVLASRNRAASSS